MEHPGVKDAGVTAWERNNGEKYLAAYIVPRDPIRPTIDRLQSFLREMLPAYMVPSSFMFSDSLPVTNGKLDRKALPEPDDKRPELSTAYALPTNEIQTGLVSIWEKILDVRPIGIRDNFFDLGGHSLSATRVVSRIFERYRLEIPLQSLFQSPTIAEMAVVITEHQGKLLNESRLSAILDELASMSDAEAQRLVSENDSTVTKK